MHSFDEENVYPYLRFFIYGLFFVSGAAGLVYEVIWVRMLNITLGATAPAVAAVLASFMAGLATGSYLGGRAVDRWRRPILWYAGCEAFIGLYAFVFSAVLLGITAAYAYVYGRLDTTELHAARFLLSSLAVFVPATAMGATLPAVVAALRSAGAGTGRGFALAYGLNTAGAVVGVLLAGYWLLWAAGARLSLYAVGAANIAVAAGALFLASRLPAYVPTTTRASDTGPAVRPWVIVVLAFVTGGLGLAAQVLWVRALSMVVGSAVYAFSTLLAVVLVAIAAASIVHRALPRRLAASDGLVFTLLAAGSLGFCLSILALRFSPHLFLWGFSRYGGGFASAQTLTLVVAALVMFIPSAAVGMILPTLVARWSGEAVGSRVGTVYAANTAGAITGSLAGTYVLLTTTGVVGGLRLLAVIAAASAVFAITNRRRAAVWAFTAPALILAAVFVPAPSHRLLNLGVGISPGYYITDDRSVYLGDAEEEEILFYDEAVDGTVAVIAYGPVLALKVNGKSVASTNYDDLRVERELGELPVRVHGAPRSVLVIGLGSGITLGSAIANPSVEKAVCVEINPAVADAAEYFSAYNGSPLDDRRVELIREDGRTYALCADDRFDVITSDPIHPWTKGSSSLFSAEHFRNCSKKLEPGGVMAQWLPLYQLSVRDYFMIINTFATAFPHIALVYTGRDTILLGKENIFGPRVTGSPYYIAGDDRLLAAAGRAGVNTEDSLALEYSAPRALYSPEESEILLELISLHSGKAATTRGAVACIMTAKYYYREGDLERAAEAAEKAWEHEKKHGWPNEDIAQLNADIAFERGLRLAEAGDTGAAVEAFEEVLIYTPGNVAARTNIELLTVKR